MEINYDYNPSWFDNHPDLRLYVLSDDDVAFLDGALCDILQKTGKSLHSYRSKHEKVMEIIEKTGLTEFGDKTYWFVRFRDMRLSEKKNERN